MVESLDLVMWAKNGAWCLPQVFSQIDKVIPKSLVCCKILVDDGSSDSTPSIGRKFGWTVYSTKGIGVGPAAQLALDHVDSEFFCSFEHDVMLHPEWLSRLLPKITSDPNIAVIQGLRLSNLKPMRVIEKWRLHRLKNPVSIDNNIYRSDIIRNVGGFPQRKFAGVDTGLYRRIEDKGLRWVVDRGVTSLHLRKSLSSDITRLYRYHTIGRDTLSKTAYTIADYARKFLTSPIRGLQIAFEFRYPFAAIIYPLMRYYSYKGVIDASKENYREYCQKSHGKLS